MQNAHFPKIFIMQKKIEIENLWKKFKILKILGMQKKMQIVQFPPPSDKCFFLLFWWYIFLNIGELRGEVHLPPHPRCWVIFDPGSLWMCAVFHCPDGVIASAQWLQQVWGAADHLSWCRGVGLPLGNAEPNRRVAFCSLDVRIVDLHFSPPPPPFRLILALAQILGPNKVLVFEAKCKTCEPSRIWGAHYQCHRAMPASPAVLRLCFSDPSLWLPCSGWKRFWKVPGARTMSAP